MAKICLNLAFTSSSVISFKSFRLRFLLSSSLSTKPPFSIIFKISLAYTLDFLVFERLNLASTFATNAFFTSAKSPLLKPNFSMPFKTLNISLRLALKSSPITFASKL